MTDMRRRLISREAQKCLKNLGLGAIPVDLEVLADKLDIILSAADRDSDGWSGMLMRQGDVFGIIYATNIDNRGFQRFSIAHELGHYCLPGHPEKVVPVDGVPHYSRADRGSKLDFEREADVFAASLLMPEDAVASLVNVDPGLDAVEALATACGTSLASAASRFAELCTSPVAVVLSISDQVVYAGMSPRFRALPDLEWLKAGAAVPPGSATWRAHREPVPARVDDATDFATWFRGGPDGELIEEAIRLGAYGRTLTVLSPQGLQDDDDEPEPAEEGPVFRRSRRR